MLILCRLGRCCPPVRHIHCRRFFLLSPDLCIKDSVVGFFFFSELYLWEEIWCWNSDQCLLYRHSDTAKVVNGCDLSHYCLCHMMMLHWHCFYLDRTFSEIQQIKAQGRNINAPTHTSSAACLCPTDAVSEWKGEYMSYPLPPFVQCWNVFFPSSKDNGTIFLSLFKCCPLSFDPLSLHC